jgi:hypothetical protein
MAALEKLTAVGKLRGAAVGQYAGTWVEGPIVLLIPCWTPWSCR